MVATEYDRYVRFEDGLRDNLRVLIALQRERDFAALVDNAKITEEVKRAERQNSERSRNKMDFEPLSSVQRHKKKARVDGSIRVGARIAATGQSLCTNCGRRHQGECWKRIGACLWCGSLEHRIRDCSRRSDQMKASGMGISPPRVVKQPPRGCGQRAPGRGANQTEARQPTLVYGARCREDGDAPDVITGSTHSYVACSVTKNFGILVENTSSEMTVLSPLGQSIRVNKLFRYVPLEVQGVIFLNDVMELSFREFDLILGIDWLVKHQMILDCATKRVVLRTEEDNEVVVIGER
ncbi:uncharacterized protein [Gossypium hirsutum]|uniref:Gag-Pol polyprotein n=1 Tax=Gossypium hirsutum TaxID=3635 RepID=A0A1U8KC70_GOSHI|nr:uncharacterized protein LOC107915428 [Gossypium hirsutum]